MTNQTAPVEHSERTWPSPDFLNTAQRLRHELEAAIRSASDCSNRVSAIEKAAFAKALPAAVIAGGADKLAKLSDEQNAATLTVIQKREELRRFLESERVKFFLLRDQAHEVFRSGISERFARAQNVAAELCAALGDLLGTEAECVRQEKLIREWNRAANKFNRTIPVVNASAIPNATGIGTGETIRGRIEQLLLANKNIRELCRELLTRKAKDRERAAETEEARIAQAEGIANPASLADPFLI